MRKLDRNITYLGCKKMTKLQWLFGKRYELSADGRGLLKYIKPGSFYHIHSDEMTPLEIRRHRILSKSNMRFA